MPEHPGLAPRSKRPSLKDMEREDRVQAIRDWFLENFEDPVHETPYNGREGGYLFIHGGPYEAADQIWDVFGGHAEDDEIEEAIEEIESDGIVDWAPAGHRILPPERDEDELDSEGSMPLPERLAALAGQLNRIEDAVAAVRKWQEHQGGETPGIGHNHPPEDDELDLPGLETSIVEVRGELARPDPQINADRGIVERAESRFRKFLGWLGEQLRAAPKSIVQGMIGGAAGYGIQQYLKDPQGTLQALQSAADTLALWLQHLAAFF